MNNRFDILGLTATEDVRREQHFDWMQSKFDYLNL